MSETVAEEQKAVTAAVEEEEEEVVELAIESVQELAAKVLGFAPLQLADDVYNVINDNLGQLIDRFGEKLTERYGTKLNPERIEKLINLFKYKLQAQQDHLFDQFDKLLVGRLLYVEPDVVLEEDRCQLRYSEKRDNATRERIQTYLKRLTALNTCQIAIENEMRELATVETGIQALRDSVSQQVQQMFNLSSVDDLYLKVHGATCELQKILSDLGDLLHSSTT